MFSCKNNFGHINGFKYFMMGVHHLGKQFQSKPISNHSVTTGFGCISQVDNYIRGKQNVRLEIIIQSSRYFTKLQVCTGKRNSTRLDNYTSDEISVRSIKRLHFIKVKVRHLLILLLCTQDNLKIKFLYTISVNVSYKLFFSCF